MTNPRPERVLLLGDDMRIFLAVARSLGRAGREVHAAPFDWSAPALTSRYVSQVHKLPRYQDDPTGWLQAILGVLTSAEIDLVIPCDDRAILPLDLHRDALAPHRLAIPPRTAMELLFDKEHTKTMARELGIPVLAGEALRPLDAGSSVLEAFGLPVVLKPRRSYWLDRLESWGRVYIPTTAAELDEALERIEDRPRYMKEAYFDQGVGVGVSVLSNRGVVELAFQHRRLREGWGGSSSYRISEEVKPELLDACLKICAHTGLTGVCMFEFRVHRENGSWVLIETNARFWGSCGLPLALGVDFPNQLFDLLVHNRPGRSIAYPAGFRSRNLVLDLFNLIKSLRRLPSGRRKAWLFEIGDFFLQPVRWVQGREASDSFAPDDLRPGIAEMLRASQRLLSASTGPAMQRRRADSFKRSGADPLGAAKDRPGPA